MARYILNWEIVEERLATDPKEIATGWKMLTSMVRKDIERGFIKDWGAFPGDHGGFTIVEGTEMDLLMFTTQYTPFIRFRTHQVSTIDTVDEFLNTFVK